MLHIGDSRSLERARKFAEAGIPLPKGYMDVRSLGERAARPMADAETFDWSRADIGTYEKFHPETGRELSSEEARIRHGQRMRGDLPAIGAAPVKEPQVNHDVQVGSDVMRLPMSFSPPKGAFDHVSQQPAQPAQPENQAPGKVSTGTTKKKAAPRRKRAAS